MPRTLSDLRVSNQMQAAIAGTVIDGLCRASDRSPSDRFQRLHDVCLVRPSSQPLGPPLVHRGRRQLGHRAVRVPPPGARQRIGFGALSLAQLKIIQEVITLGVFIPFAVLYMRQPVTLNFLWAGFCLMGAVYFMFR